MQLNVAELKAWSFDWAFHLKSAEVFNLILHEIDFYLNLTSPPSSQSSFKISSLCQEKRFPFIYKNNKVRSYEKDHHLTLWQMEKELHLAAIITQEELKLYQQNKNIDPATILPPQYCNYLDVFSKKKADILPLHQAYDHAIHLKKGAQPPVSALYDMSCDEALELCQYLNENLSKEFI